MSQERQYLLYLSIYESDHGAGIKPALNNLELSSQLPHVIISDYKCVQIARTLRHQLTDFFPSEIELPEVKGEKKFFNVRNEIMNVFHPNAETELIILIGHWNNNTLLKNAQLEPEEGVSYDYQNFLLLDLKEARIISPLFKKKETRQLA